MMEKKVIFSIFLVLAMLYLFLTSFQKQGNPDSFSKTVKVALRDAGSKLLLANKDSTSLILPIKKYDDRHYEISFQRKLSIAPDSLVAIVNTSLKSAKLPKHYIVEVVNCENQEVAYSYKINFSGEKDIIPCLGRTLPVGCYKIDVLFLEKHSFFNDPGGYILLGITMLFLVLLVLVQKPKKKSKEPVMSSIAIGNYKFYKDQNKLVKGGTEINLSAKECEIVTIFSKHQNQVVKRDVLIKEIWEDNGVFVGRSLDTFISKLRKKFAEDDSVNIVNVHGVGYKLEVK